MSQSAAPAAYLDNTGRDDVLQRRQVDQNPDTKRRFSCRTKRVGNNPTIKALLLHENARRMSISRPSTATFPTPVSSSYYYDQLGSAYSDQPDEPTLWDVPRFVEEVEQVRKALKLDKSNFYLYGQSWGGVLALEYAPTSRI